MSQSIPETALALSLLDQAQCHGAVLAILRSASRLTRVAALAEAMAVGTEVLALPPWDTLPYDRTLPTTAAVGRRVRTLLALSQAPLRPRLLLASATVTLIRVRPPRAWDGAALILRPGEALNLETLRLQLAERGYHWDEHVDEPGEVALRGHAVDLFPVGDNLPLHLDLDDAHRIASIQAFDPLTQRTIVPAQQAVITQRSNTPSIPTSKTPRRRHSTPTPGTVPTSRPRSCSQPRATSQPSATAGSDHGLCSRQCLVG